MNRIKRQVTLRQQGLQAVRRFMLLQGSPEARQGSCLLMLLQLDSMPLAPRLHRRSFRVQVFRHSTRVARKPCQGCIAMKAASGSAMVRFWAGAFCMLGAWISLAPATAQAGCSQHSWLLSARGEALAFLELIAPASGQTATLEQSPAVPRKPARCTGSMCSGHVPLPVSTHSPDGPRSMFWPLLDASPAVNAPEPFLAQFVEPDVPAIRTNRTVFHPPRPIDA